MEPIPKKTEAELAAIARKKERERKKAAKNRPNRTRYVPHQYQTDVLYRMEDKGILALLLDPGMGKTSICLEDFRRRYAIGDANRGLVVAPLRTCHNVWPQEVDKWVEFHHLTTVVAHGRNKDVDRVNEADLTIINPEGLEWLVKQDKKVEPFECLYVDESTLFKTASSKRSKNLYKIAHRVNGGIPYRFILTGTPAPNGVADLYGQFGVLDPDILGRTLGAFRRDYKFISRHAPWGVIWEPGKESADLIQERIAPYSVRLDATDHLDLPDLVKVKRMVQLPRDARKVYDLLKEEMFAELESGSEIMAMNPGVLTAKCRQVANGAVYLSDLGEAVGEESKKVEYVHTAKVESLAALWEELGQRPLLVAYEFRHDLTVIKTYMKDKFKFTPRYIGGGATDEEVQESIDQWNAGELPMLLVNPQSAAHGLNLQAGGHHLAWYSMPFSLESYIQLNGRLWRQGQTEGVFVHHILAEKTVDEAVWKLIENKNKTQRKLLDYVKETK